MSSARKPTKRSGASGNAADSPATTAAPAAPVDQPLTFSGMTNDELGSAAAPQTLLVELARGSTARDPNADAVGGTADVPAPGTNGTAWLVNRSLLTCAC
jgi:hypothetical protein